MKRMSPAGKRYLARFFPVIAAYVIVLLAVDWTFRHHPPTGVLKYSMAAAPALPVIGLIVVMGLYLVEEKDEFERSILVQSMLWGIGVTLSFNTLVESLINFAGMHPLPTFHLFTLFVVVFGFAQPLIRRRYQ